jgi:hypothetical protein
LTFYGAFLLKIGQAKWVFAASLLLAIYSGFKEEAAPTIV